MKKEGLAKLVAGIIIPILTLSGCRTYVDSYRKRPLTDSETHYREDYKNTYPIQVPVDIQYTIMDPAPFAHSPIYQPDLIPKKENPTEE